MHLIDRAASRLVLVDYQPRLLPAIHRGDAAVAQAAFLARMAKLVGVPVVGTEQNPERMGQNVPAIRELCDHTVGKMHFDACRAGLLEALRQAGPQAHAQAAQSGQSMNAGQAGDLAKLVGDASGPPGIVVIAGCEAHVCLLQTALSLLQAGFAVFAVADASGSRFPDDHRLAMRRLERAGAVVVGAEMVAFEWLESCEDAAFKPALALIKQRDAG